MDKIRSARENNNFFCVILEPVEQLCEVAKKETNFPLRLNSGLRVSM